MIYWCCASGSNGLIVSFKNLLRLESLFLKTCAVRLKRKAGTLTSSGLEKLGGGGGKGERDILAYHISFLCAVKIRSADFNKSATIAAMSYDE